MKRIATHRKPDADAILSAYLMQRYAFGGEATVVFISRGVVLSGFDCAVDVGHQYDPARLYFDHKPPAFADRNSTCASHLVWKWLLARGERAQEWRELVRLVHEGDARPPRRASPALKASRSEGFHALIKAARAQNAPDSALYERGSAYLEALAI